MRLKPFSQLMVVSYLTALRLFSLSLVLFLSACGSLFETQMDANTAYQTKQYVVAAQLFEEQYTDEKNLINKSRLAYKIGESYRLANRTREAESWYARAIEYTQSPDASFKYALMLKSNGKYSEAMQLFKEYALENPTERARASAQIQASKQALEWQKKPTDYRVRSLNSINSDASDFSPMPYMNDELVFTSDRAEATGRKTYGWTGEKHQDLFVVKRQKNNTFANPTLFGDSLNTDYNEGTVSFSPDYKEIYFTGCGSDSNEGIKDDFCHIYTARKNEKGDWSLPEIIPLFDADTINTGEPFLAFGGTQLYFWPTRPVGLATRICTWSKNSRNGRWSAPRNLAGNQYRRLRRFSHR